MPADKKRIYIIGLPGSGKTKYGKKIAQYLHWTFIDTDEYICQQMQCSIQEIFDQHGEAYFRALEHDTLIDLSQLEHVVISTGGGLVAYHNNMSIIKDTGWSIYMDTPLHILSSRLMTDDQRPLFKDLGKGGIQSKLEQLYEIRKKYYEQADEKINHQGDIWKTLRELLNKNKNLERLS